MGESWTPSWVKRRNSSRALDRRGAQIAVPLLQQLGREALEIHLDA